MRTAVAPVAALPITVLSLLLAAGCSGGSGEQSSPKQAKAPEKSAEKSATDAAHHRSGRPSQSRTFAAKVHSMTEGAEPAGMDGKAFLLFSPYWAEQWKTQSGEPSPVHPDDKGVVTLTNAIATSQQLRDVQVHLEFRIPTADEARAARAEVLLHGAYGVVLCDSMNRPQRPNSCGAISERIAPETAACLPPGAWQTMDIAFRAPRPERPSPSGRGQPVPAEPARITVLHNGVMVQNCVDIPMPTEVAKTPAASDRAALVLIPRSGRIDFRNIWIRSLDGSAAATP